MRQRIGLQSPPYVGLLSILILTIWLLAIGIGTTLIVLALFRSSLPVDKVAPGGFPLAMLGTVVIRAIVFLGWESHTLFNIVGERQYYRWASSFRGIEAKKFVGVDDGDGKRCVSYQYRPWWVAVTVMVGSVALIVSGRRFAVMVWATVPGCALLVETGLRFGLEVLWLWTPVGDMGKRVRLRWLPWLSIPVRSY